jgi:hypothetical protein
LHYADAELCRCCCRESSNFHLIEWILYSFCRWIQNHIDAVFEKLLISIFVKTMPMEKVRSIHRYYFFFVFCFAFYCQIRMGSRPISLLWKTKPFPTFLEEIHFKTMMSPKGFFGKYTHSPSSSNHYTMKRLYGKEF